MIGPAPARNSPDRDALQREVTERLLLSALREAEAADRATEGARRREAFLADLSRRLSESVDEADTRRTLAALALPDLAPWCMVDIIEPNGTISRLAMVHPNPDVQALIAELASSWKPDPGDTFGAASVVRSAAALQPGRVDEALQAAAPPAGNVRILRELQAGALLTVPLVSRGQLLGAITFVSADATRSYSSEEIHLAEAVASRSAEALDNARRYGEALRLRELANVASQSRLKFLGTISHELRTPLNAIMGYVEIITAEVHGPLTDAQRTDLDRIRLNQEHLLVLINDLLNFVRTGTSRVHELQDVDVCRTIGGAYGLLESLIQRKSIQYETVAKGANLIAHAEAEGVEQIIVNLIGNAIKFTPRGGRITTTCEGAGDNVKIEVHDEGIGIAPEMLESIFEPFVQVAEDRGLEGGSGLGLAISRNLALAMNGTLTVTSTIGRGSCFTLTLPRARMHAPAGRVEGSDHK